MPLSKTSKDRADSQCRTTMPTLRPAPRYCTFLPAHFKNDSQIPPHGLAGPLGGVHRERTVRRRTRSQFPLKTFSLNSSPLP
ncbi:uncharacterized protein LACBIDRAFT_305102 [Laccaria bicolor S238N-H82]|uniref:Predicted protein n=1 Tax=Laccaria bicolor (strain S238N-H82 / ATCC MYA-4686) TaxID=486041 RepID=B0CTF1_LACBS|nr:uncharacterized protein LACBIDRAFT_305102 [Laccaria bicolor S238N-H82]EDR14484.1 predicted protein [Laccaria bicolor S238N-H82]|eukprot:XP_001875043.1 predicted protein [Laccaria bicolor S238N-H82]